MLHPDSDYSQFNLEVLDDAAGVLDENPFLDDVSGAFTRLADQGDLLAAGDSGVFEGNRAYRYTSLNQAGWNAGVNHLQGMQRLPGGQHLVVSAGDSTEPVSHLFVIRMGSRPLRGAWGSNLIRTGSPPPTDGIVRVVALDRNHWHAGGLGMLGEILAVPLEGGDGSRVLFLNTRDPENPTAFPGDLRPGFDKAGAVALARLPDGRYLCVVWREEGKTAPVGRLDYYLSKTDRFTDGFGEDALTVPFAGLPLGVGRDPQYQSITLVSPAGGGGGEVGMYLLGCENDSDMSPLQNGSNLVDLFELTLRPDTIPGGPPPVLRHVDTREFHAPREYFNLDAAAGVSLAERSGSAAPRLLLYGAYHWRVERALRFAEFRTLPGPNESITELADAWIDLYEHDKFRGRRLSVYGNDEASISNYSEIFVQDGDFNEKVSSVRFQIPVGWAYRLYRNADFAGDQANQDFLELKGTGAAQEIANLKRRKFGDEVSSSRFVRLG